ncbi:MAG: PSP1 C-terminal domain-containing protein [Isosphaeraceae bacterium]|nr:PSP1 C-terminal domain-containing protein [Isosphaeraceae bacterium]
MEHAFYVRYGLMGRVGRFLASAEAMERGQHVVLQTHRGTELGEVLLPAPLLPTDEFGTPPRNTARVLRAATHDDLARADRSALDRHRRFAVCQQVFEEGVWPFDLIDVEPLLDDQRTVVHYLGPHDLDVSGLLAAFRAVHGLDVVFEAAGVDASEGSLAAPPESEATGCGHCGSGGAGCGSGGCGTSEHGGGGCSDCALMKRTSRVFP